MQGWRLNWESRLFQDGPAIVNFEAGLRRRFMPEAGVAGGYRNSDGDRITAGAGGWRLARLDGTSDLFDGAGQLVERDLGNEKKIKLTYSAPGRIARIEGPFQSSLTFTYGADGRLTQIDVAAGGRVAYVYAGERLAEMRKAIRP